MKTAFAALFAAVLMAAAIRPPDGPVEFKVPPGWPKPVWDFTKNPLSSEKIALGRALFYDPILSRDGSVSCASCHLSYVGFAHVDHPLSHGIQNRIGLRNSLALVNLAWNKNFMWDGAVNHLEMQPLAPISHPDEMGSSIGEAVGKLAASARYPKIFARAFGDTAVNSERVLKSMAQFMLTIVSADSRYDKVMRKEAIFNEWEQKGLEIFRKNCESCHREPLFTDFSFQNNGLGPDPSLHDGGRIRVTKDPADSLKFRVPSLRNCEITAPYMHDGRLPNLQMVLFHYTEDVFQSETLAKPLRKKMVLSEGDKDCLIAFLRTLTDEAFLRDGRFSFPRPGKEN